MSIRTVGESVEGWFDSTTAIINNDHILDWPISILIFVFVLAAIGFSVVSLSLGKFFGWLVGKAIISPSDMQKQIEQEHGIPRDPQLRHHWANRTGPFSPEVEAKADSIRNP